MKILVSDPITENGLAVLKNANFDIVELPNGSPEEKAESCKDADGWIIRSGTKITAAMIETAKNLFDEAIEKIQLGVYALCGFLAGLAGIIHAAQNHQGSPNAGVMYELEAIAAVVIGGTALSGGKGSISGTIIGTLIMGIMTNILRLNNVDANIEMVLKSIIIIIAVKIQTGRSES